MTVSKSVKERMVARLAAVMIERARSSAAAALVVVGLAAAMAGCQEPEVDAVMAPGTPADDPLPASAYPQIVLHGNLQQVLVKEKPSVAPPDQFQPLTVRVPIRSVTNNPLFLEYRFVFYGPNKDQTSMNPVWRTISIPPRTRRFISANAIDMNAVDWELEIKRQ